MTEISEIRTRSPHVTSQTFLELGYVWNDNSLVRPPSLPGYCFDPTDIDYSINEDPNVANDQRIEKEA